MEDKEPSMDEILSSIRRLLSAEETVQEEVVVVPPVQTKSEPVIELTSAMMVGESVPEEMVLLESDPVMPREEPKKETTLEALVVALVKPYIKEWLDANLPVIIEKAVREEVHKRSHP